MKGPLQLLTILALELLPNGIVFGLFRAHGIDLAPPADDWLLSSPSSFPPRLVSTPHCLSFDVQPGAIQTAALELRGACRFLTVKFFHTGRLEGARMFVNRSAALWNYPVAIALPCDA